MRILMLFHTAPYPPDLGPSRRHYHVLRELLKRHEITVVSTGTSKQREEFLLHFGNVCRDVLFVDNTMPSPLKWIARFLHTLRGRSALHMNHRRMGQALDNLIAKTRFDLIICSIPFLADCALGRGIPVVSDTHNVEWLRLQRSYLETPSLWRKAYYWLQARSTRVEEIASASRVQAVLTTSECDRSVFMSCLPRQRFFVIPNGLDLTAYAPSPAEPAPQTLLFTGLMSYYPNVHGIAWFLNEIFPRVRQAVPHVRIVIAGAQPPRSLRRRASECVNVTGYVPDIRPYFAQAEIFVVPLRIGGGTRVKILEAMAMKRAVVTTTLGCEGLDVVNGESLLIADTPDEFAEAVVRLVGDKGLRESLASRGAALVRQRYGWDNIGAKLDGVVHRVQDIVHGVNNGPDPLESFAGGNVCAAGSVETSETRFW